MTKPAPTHPLSQAEPGRAHRVCGIADGPHSPRLYEIGFGEGTEVVVVKRGDPAIVAIGTGRFALAAGLLELVTVACDDHSK